MEFKPSTLEWALGLFDYPTALPDPSDFAGFYHRATNLFYEWNFPPTHIAVGGKDYSGKFGKFGGRETKRLIDSSFENISVLSLLNNPTNSSQPSYDRYVHASLSRNVANELQLCLVANDSILPFQGEEFHKVILDLLQWRQWSFGFGFRDLIARQPDFHILSIDTGKLSEDESKALCKWYSSKPQERQRKLRGAYPLMVLNKEQISQPVHGARSLGDLIQSNSGARVETVGELLVWSFPPSQLDTIREQFRGSPALI